MMYSAAQPPGVHALPSRVAAAAGPPPPEPPLRRRSSALALAALDQTASKILYEKLGQTPPPHTSGWLNGLEPD